MNAFVIWEIIIYNTCMLVMFPVNLDTIGPMLRESMMYDLHKVFFFFMYNVHKVHYVIYYGKEI